MALLGLHAQCGRLHASFMAMAFSLLNNLGVDNWTFLGCSRGTPPGQASRSEAVFLNFSCLEASHRACSISNWRR